MSYNIFGTGTQPTLFKGKIQNNCENCNNAGDTILTCEDVLLCINLNLFANLTNPYIPYWDGTQFQNTTLSRVVDAGPINIALDRGTSFRSHISGEAQFGFSASGDEFLLTTDGGLMAESWLSVNPTYAEIGSAGTNYVGIYAGYIQLSHTATIDLLTPIVTANDIKIGDTKSINCSQVLGTVGLFNNTASVVNLGRAGATLNIASATFFTAAVDVNANLDATSFSVGGTAGVSFSGAITNITVVNGIVTAAS